MQHPSPYHRSSLYAERNRISRACRLVAATFLVAWLLGIATSVTHAQLIPDNQWAVFRQNDGLLDSDLYVVLPVNGAVWFGGQGGVSRFDGTWTTYPLAQPAVISTTAGAEAPVSRVTAMVFADDHTLLVGTQDGWVWRLVDGVWEEHQYIGSPINALLAEDDATWVGADAGLTRIEAGRQIAVAALQDKKIHALHAGANDGLVWIGASDGLWQVSADGANVHRFAAANGKALPNGAATAITQDSSGALWVGIESAIVQFLPDQSQFQVYQPFELPHTAQISTIGVGADASVWVAANNSGVVKYTFENGKQVAATNYGSVAGSGLDTDIVRDLAVDADGAVWFATPIGASRHYPGAWVSVGEAFNGLPIADLAVDADDDLWIATDGEGVIRLSNGQRTRTDYYPGITDLAGAVVPEIIAAADGRVWTATQNGVSVFANGRWQNPIDAGALPSPAVRALTAAADGLWIGVEQGLAYYDFAAQTLTHEPALAGQHVQDLQLDGAGRLWLLTEAGDLLVRRNDGQWLAAADVRQGLPEGARVVAFFVAANQEDVAFAAVEGQGIFRWDGSAWAQYGLHDEWLDGRILVLRLDDDGRSLWIGSNIGVGRLDEVGLTVYDARDGAASGAIRSIVPTPQDGYWFGGQKGLWRFESEPSAPVLSSGAIVGDVEREPDAWQAYVGRQLSIYFDTGDIHTTADRIQVFYRVAEGDRWGAWKPTRGRSIPLAFAAPGAYQVELVARDLSFNYSTPVIHTVNAVTPPPTVLVPWLGVIQTRIFGLMLIFAAIACVGLGYVGYEYLRLRRRASAAVRRRFNPYVSGEPVRREDMFFGRQDLVARIAATLHNNSIMIHGERRIGKTTLLYQLANVLRKVRDKSYWFLPVYVDMEGTTETKLFHLLMEDILGVVNDLAELSPGAHTQIAALHFWAQADGKYDDRTFGRDLRTIMTILEEYALAHQQARQVRLILLMDEMDTLSRFDRVYQQQLRRIFMRDFAATLGAVVAGIELSKDWDRVESPWFNLFNEIEIQPLTHVAARELLVKPVQNYYRYDEDALQFILAQCEGRPFRVQQYGLESVNHMLRQRRRRIRMEDVLYAHNLIQSEQNIQAAQAGLTRQAAVEGAGLPTPGLLLPT